MLGIVCVDRYNCNYYNCRQCQICSGNSKLKKKSSTIKWKTKHTTQTVLQYSNKTVEIEAKSIFQAHKYVVAQKSDGIKLVLCDQTPPFNLFVWYSRGYD